MRLPSRRKAGQHNDRSRGQSLVEFALVLPLILLLMLIAIDFGRVFLGWVGLNNAARVAANYAAMHPNSSDWDPEPKPGPGRISEADRRGDAEAELHSRGRAGSDVSRRNRDRLPGPSRDHLSVRDHHADHRLDPRPGPSGHRFRVVPDPQRLDRRGARRPGHPLADSDHPTPTPTPTADANAGSERNPDANADPGSERDPDADANAVTHPAPGVHRHPTSSEARRTSSAAVGNWWAKGQGSKRTSSSFPLFRRTTTIGQPVDQSEPAGTLRDDADHRPSHGATAMRMTPAPSVTARAGPGRVRAGLPGPGADPARDLRGWAARLRLQHARQRRP